jgi:hypothetical protein
MVKSLIPPPDWRRHARQNWNAEPEELEREPAEPGEFLGKAETVAPELAPVEFLWSGDSVVLCTGGIARRVDEDRIQQVVSSRSPERAAAKLVSLALDRGGESNLTALVLAVRESGKGTAGVRGPTLFSSPLTRTLGLASLLLICLLALVTYRADDLRNSLGGILAPAPTIEIAKPFFISTATPTPGLDIGPTDAADPFSFPPGITPTPAAAPTLAPQPTFTPRPLPQDWTNPPAPQPVVPAEGYLFGGPDAEVILAWNPVANLPEDMFYVVTIRKFVDGRLIGESRNWTKSTRIRLDWSFYTAMEEGPRKTGLGAPLLQTPPATFEWSVAIYQLTSIAPDGTLNGILVSPVSPSRTFLWGPAPAPAPTRVYGGQGLDTDPFFSETRQRAAAADGLISPVSAGMAGLSLLLGTIAGRPKLKSRLGRGSRRRTRL